MTRVQTLLALDACRRLVLHDLFMSMHPLSELTDRIRRISVRKTTHEVDVEEIVRAIDLASCFYPKSVRCLQRSSVLVGLLRKRGIDARMIIGAQKLPFKAHAWVQVEGRVLSDHSAERERYFVLEEC